jgi:integration host factor subunit alpha
MIFKSSSHPVSLTRLQKEHPLMTVAQADLIDTIYSGFDFSKAKSPHMVESLPETIKNTLASGEDILISGFGKFVVMKKEERKGRNPHTGEGLMLGERKVVWFKCSGVLREQLNGEGDSLTEIVLKKRELSSCRGGRAYWRQFSV